MCSLHYLRKRASSAVFCCENVENVYIIYAPDFICRELCNFFVRFYLAGRAEMIEFRCVAVDIKDRCWLQFNGWPKYSCRSAIIGVHLFCRIAVGT